MEETRITPRTALVGGGAGGIGRATAEALLRTGHRVILAGRTEETLAAAASDLHAETGGEASYVVADLTDSDSATDGFSAAEGRWQGLDVLVVNAGGPPPGRILDVSEEQWQTSFDLLVNGPLRLARLAMPRMAERGFGRVVIITSTAVRQPQPGLATSVVMRSALTAAAKLLSAEYAREGVTVNCVAPGATDTARLREILQSRAAALGIDYSDAAAAEAATIPAGRTGTPEEVAAAVAFLASAAASYVNGTVLTVDGGRTEAV